VHILIVRLSALGDIVHAIPAAAALRRAYPDARIDWLLDARHRDIVDLVTGIDRVIVIQRSSPMAWIQVLGELRADRYDVACDFQGLLKSAVLARGSGASEVAGFALGHLRERLARPFYTTTAPAEGGHAIQKNLRLLQTLGIHDTRIEFPIAQVESEALQTLRTAIGGAPFAVITPGAAWPNKRWPADRYGQLAGVIRDRTGLIPVVLWGPGEDALARAVVDSSAGTAVLAPPTTVRDIVAVCRAADLFVAGDTGPLHIAMAVGTPTVSLFGPTDPVRNGPFAVNDLVVSRAGQCHCHIERQCRHSRWCLEDIGVSEVSAVVERRLATGATRG
jgi:lipopolysaccharide heptosyltransferase I